MKLKWRDPWSDDLSGDQEFLIGAHFGFILGQCWKCQILTFYNKTDYVNV